MMLESEIGLQCKGFLSGEDTAECRKQGLEVLVGPNSELPALMANRGRLPLEFIAERGGSGNGSGKDEFVGTTEPSVPTETEVL